MRIINALIADWKCKTTAEKIKTVLHGISMIGGGVIGNAIGDKCADAAGRGPISKTCTKLTGLFLGSVAAEMAAKSMDETVDTFDQLIQNRKKEEKANA